VEKGSYSGRRLNFDSFAASCFRPYLFGDEVRTRYGCGACALSLLTGAPPEEVSVKNNSPHYPDRFMVRFLRDHGFEVQRLTQCNVANGLSKIEKQHVILLSQMFRKREATWGIIFSGLYFHNFQVYFLETLSLIRKPIVTAYLVGHPTWRNCSLHWEDKPPKHKTALSGLSFTALGLIRKKSRASSRKS
jgi:hypothetical protein